MWKYLSFLMLLTGAARAQDSAASSEKTHFIAGFMVNSGLNYYGRVDSLKSKGGGPFVGLSLKNGMYVNATVVFIHNSLQSQYAATMAEGGYNFRNKKGSWAGNLSTTRFFYQGNTDLIQSTIRQSITASVTQLNGIVNITVGGDVKFSNRADPGAQAGLDHIIRWSNVFGSGVLVLDPSAYVYAGTQHFTQTFYQQKQFLLLPAGEEQLTRDVSSFSVLSYELSLPIVYGYKKLNLIFSPAYVLPRHVLAGKAGNLFYVTATVKLTL